MSKKAKNTYIQVFLTGDDICEIDALERYPYGLCIDSNEDGFKQRHLIPYSQIRMVRIYND